MSIEQNKTTINRWVAAMNERDFEKIDPLADELYASDYVLHAGFPGSPASDTKADTVKQGTRDFMNSMPDLKITINDMVSEGDRIASRWTMTGTDATTKTKVTLTLIGISRFVNGRFAEEWALLHSEPA